MPPTAAWDERDLRHLTGPRDSVDLEEQQRTSTKCLNRLCVCMHVACTPYIHTYMQTHTCTHHTHTHTTYIYVHTHTHRCGCLAVRSCSGKSTSAVMTGPCPAERTTIASSASFVSPAIALPVQGMRCPWVPMLQKKTLTPVDPLQRPPKCSLSCMWTHLRGWIQPGKRVA